MSRRITIAILGVVTAALLLVGTGTLYFARISNRTQALRTLERQVSTTAELIPVIGVAAPSATNTNRGNSNRGSNSRDRRSQLFEALNLTGVGEVLVGSSGRISGALPHGVTATDLDIGALTRGDVVSGVRGNTLWAAAAREVSGPRGRTGKLVTVLTRTQERFFGPTFRWFAFFSGISIIMAGVVAAGLGRRLAGPVRAAVVATHSISEGDLSSRVDRPHLAPDDELVVLADSINAMADRLQKARDQERSFLLSVSHDLRTPMTSIRGYAEAIADNTVDDPKRAAGVILGETRRLERLVGDLLELAKLDSDRFELHLVVTDVSEIALGTADGFGPELTDAGLRLITDIEPHQQFDAHVDVDRLSQVVANLLTNAVSFARHTVTVTVRREGGACVIDVSDDGPGIELEQLHLVFERLYQADNQRSRRSAGSGLGLAIVSELVQRMGGTVEVASRAGEGTTFTVRLPAA